MRRHVTFSRWWRDNKERLEVGHLTLEQAIEEARYAKSPEEAKLQDHPLREDRRGL